MRKSLVLLRVTPLWQVGQWVSRAPPHYTRPAFLNLNGTPNFCKTWIKPKSEKGESKLELYKIEICVANFTLINSHAGGWCLWRLNKNFLGKTRFLIFQTLILADFNVIKDKYLTPPAWELSLIRSHSGALYGRSSSNIRLKRIRDRRRIFPLLCHFFEILCSKKKVPKFHKFHDLKSFDFR